MTKASKEAYAKPENKEKRKTHKEICFDCLINKALTSRELTQLTKLGHEETKKRLSDLHGENRIKIVGEKKEDGNTVSIYAINPDESDWRNKKISLRQFIKGEYPLILEEYNGIFN